MMKFAILLAVCAIAKVYGNEPEAIVGGMNASPGQFPHQVSLQVDGYHICGGTLISNKHVVTAGHCISSQKECLQMTVVTGTTKLSGDGEVHRVKCCRIHPEYGSNPYAVDYDIAVLTLATPISFNKQQSSVKLASKDYSVGGDTVIVSGWGQTSVSSDSPDILQWLPVRSISTQQCQEAHGSESISERQICTYLIRGRGTCMGDSGGPLIWKDELIGIVSWGTPCALGDPDVFTNVFAFRSFIEQCQRQCYI